MDKKEDLFKIKPVGNKNIVVEDKRKTIDSLTTEMTISEGLINTYSNEENKLYFEISENLLGKDLLVEGIG